MRKINNKIKRKLRNRKKLKSVNVNRYRISVTKSLNNLFAQIIDDKQKKTLVSAAITKYEGQISTWKNSKKLPCYRCLFANEPIDNNSNNCSSNGVLGSIGGVFGSLQATEVIKETLKIGNSLAGFLNIYDLLNNTFRKIKVTKDPNCILCSRKKNDSCQKLLVPP